VKECILSDVILASSRESYEGYKFVLEKKKKKVIFLF